MLQRNYTFCVITPIQTSTMRKNNIHKTKTDKVDTYIIAKTLLIRHSLNYDIFKSGIHQKSVYAVLKEVPSTADIPSMHLTHLSHLLEVSCYGQCKTSIATELRILAEKSVDYNDSSISTLR